MATVNIIIKGIAMTYHKEDGIWKILFPIGDCHELKFKEGDNDPGIFLAQANRQIQITTQNAESEFEIDETYSQFLDLTADYSHTDGVKLKDDWSENAVLMSIGNAKLSMYEQTTTEHMMLIENSVTLAPTNIAYSAQAVTSGERIIVNVDNETGFPKVYEDDCTLIFDNDCGEGDERETSDFDMVYNVVEGINAAEERYVVTKVDESIDYPIEVGKVFEEDDDTRDPFAKGLPCHIVKVSKSENLL
jgi:hypothetical protein